MKPHSFAQSGFTLLEISIVIAIIIIILSIIGINLFGAQRNASLTAAMTIFTSDVKGQQLKAMNGVTEGRSNADSYGIFFQTDRYTLFYGSSYSNSDPSNFIVKLEQNIIFSEINFPNNSIVFSQLSGEVVNFSPTQNSLTIKNTSGNEQKIITINKYGVIIGEEP